MNHVSGYRCYLDVGFLGNGMAIQPLGAAFAAQARQQDVNFAPDEKFMYCNGGYHLLSICIERVSGLPFETFLKTRLFEPLDMLDTDSAPGDFAIHRGLATLHVAKPGGGWQRGIFPSEEVRGEGGMISTLDDMLRWLTLLRTRDVTVMSAQSWEQMTTPAQLANGMATGYGLGLMVHRYRDVNVIHHAGGVVGGAAQMLTVPDHDLDIVILTNGAPLDPIKTAYAIVDIILDEALSSAAEVARVEHFAGWKGAKYHSSLSGMVIGFDEAAGPDNVGKLGFSLLCNPAVPIVLLEDKLVIAVETMAIGPISIDLPDELDSAPASLSIQEGSIREQFELLPSDPPVIAEWADALVGSYASPDAGAQASLVREDAELLLSVTGRVGSIVYAMEPLSENVFQCRLTDKMLPLSVVLNVLRDERSATGFKLTSGRTRGLQFERMG